MGGPNSSSVSSDVRLEGPGAFRSPAIRRSDSRETVPTLCRVRTDICLYPAERNGFCSIRNDSRLPERLGASIVTLALHWTDEQKRAICAVTATIPGYRPNTGTAFY